MLTLVTLPGLVDDDFGMELLVGGAIISLNLPVRLVWECIWRPTLAEANDDDDDDEEEEEDYAATAGVDIRGTGGRGDIEIMGPPMVVTYRLQVCDAPRRLDILQISKVQATLASLGKSGTMWSYLTCTICLFSVPIKSLETSLPGKLRLVPHAPSPGWHMILRLLLSDMLMCHAFTLTTRPDSTSRNLPRSWVCFKAWQ